MALTQTLDQLRQQLEDVAKQTTVPYGEVLKTAISYLEGESASSLPCKAVCDVDTLATRWGVSRYVIYRMVKTGELKPFLVGREYRFTAEEVFAHEQAGQ